MGIRAGAAVLGTDWHSRKSLKTETQQLLPSDSAIPLPGLCPTEIETCSHKNLYTDTHGCSVSRHGQKVETTRMSTNWWPDKPDMVHPHNRMFHQRRGWSSDAYWNVNEAWKWDAPWRKPVTHGRALYGSLSRKCPQGEKGGWSVFVHLAHWFREREESCAGMLRHRRWPTGKTCAENSDLAGSGFALSSLAKQVGFGVIWELHMGEF